MPVVVPSGLAASAGAARVVAVIPARFSSTRLPGKPLADIGGRPMVEHVFRRATEATRVDLVVVATDDQRVADVIDACGGMAVMTRADHQTGTDRLAEVARALPATRLVVNVQGDEPLMSGDAIDQVIQLLDDRPDAPMSTLRRRLDAPADLTNPDVVKLVVTHEGYALYFSRAALPHVRPGQRQPVLWRHLGLYGYRREFLLRLSELPQTPLELAEGLEQLRALEHGFRISTAETTLDTIGVDTPEDLERVRRLVTADARG